MRQILVEIQDGADIYVQISDIVQAWQSGQYKQLLIHMYSGLEDEKSTAYTAKLIHLLFPGVDLVGTMSAGEIIYGHLMKKGILISALFFESTDVQVRRYDNVKGNEAKIGKLIREELDGITDIKAAEMLLPGTEFETKALFDEIDSCSKDIRIFGGCSGGHELNAQDHYVFDASGIKYDSIFVTTFAGKDFHIDLDKVIGWEPLGVPFKVTKANGHKLIELDGRPASEVYEKFLQIDRRVHDNAQEGYTFPLLAENKNEQWLRSAIHIEEDGSLNMHGYIIEGMDIQLSYGNPAEIVKQVNERLERIRRFKPQAIFIYSCIVRKAFWERYVDLEITPFERLASTSGFYTWGELIRDDTGEIVEHNVTQLSIAMREGDAPDTELPEVQVDDSILRGPAAQMRRLTSLVYITMEDLQNAQTDLRELNDKLKSIAEHDALTGLYNRGKTEEMIYGLFDKSAADNIPISLIMIDIDHFKHVNDFYGHQAGDKVLKETAELLKNAAAEHPGGSAGRWGGEEFFLLFPEVSNTEAMDIAEDLRKKVEEHLFSEVGHLTISLGVITVIGKVNGRDVFLDVDSALYDAKEGGRNRVVNCRERFNYE